MEKNYFIQPSLISELLARINLADLIGRTVILKKNGANFSGLCPFHQEKTPSFTVSPEKQFYHCFGCGAHGTAINFLINYHGLNFLEATRQLANEVGLKLPEYKAKNTRKSEANSQSLSDLMAQACNAYRQQLRDSQQAIAYCKSRRISGAIAAHFNLGYAPNQWNYLSTVIKPYPSPLLSEAGLIIKSEKANTQNETTPIEFEKQNRYYDRFRHRITFPIRNTKGQIIAFGARALDNDTQPKYLNSPETPLFTKGRELYGLYEARQAIRKAGYVVVVEGYMDVIMLAQYDFLNVVATLGTACTDAHIQKLLLYTPQIIFSFDGDQAGQKAARRALEAALPYLNDQRLLKFLFLPNAHDPDSFIQQYGTTAFSKAIDKALPLSQFLVEQLCVAHTENHPEHCAKLLAQAKPLLQAIPKSILRWRILELLGQKIQMPAEEIAQLCELAQTIKKRKPLKAEQRRVPNKITRVLKSLVMYPQLVTRLNTREKTILQQQTQGFLFQHLFSCFTQLEQCKQINFHHLAHLLRHSPYADHYESIFDAIFAIDENVRDLLLIDEPTQNLSHEQQEERQQQHQEELKAIIQALEYDALCIRLKQLEEIAEQKTLNEQQKQEYTELFQKTLRYKQKTQAVS